MTNFRKTKKEDFIEISNWDISKEDLLFWANLTPDEEGLEGRLKSWNSESFVSSYVLTSLGAVVGYGELWMETKEVEIARILIHPEKRDHGYGKQLTTRLVEEAVSKGLETWLRVHPENKKAERLYLSLGFVRTLEVNEKYFNRGSKIDYKWMFFT